MEGASQGDARLTHLIPAFPSALVKLMMLIGGLGGTIFQLAALEQIRTPYSAPLDLPFSPGTCRAFPL